ncbi:hypothetical protein EDD37DRAFT_407074 [Exophiala viscosa]|uniref:ASX DEUBAD domain-containing protein n=1 Tax=Exophiala viscosa TaxID=2486360 RepID=A0AAN6DZ58_9EURO|nr:hypothetical protein EDD36DRAFT_165829 [Exophiala viscosa]KAI1624303.1 hypothetical protein EDD37DRAFT_407074 [Exophiala viscosa]
MAPKKSTRKASKSSKTSKTSSAGTTKPASTPSGPWSAARVLNGSSLVVAKNIHAFLVAAISGWSTDYTEAEKRAIIDSLPPRLRQYNEDIYGALVCPLTADMVQNDANIKAAVPKFKQNVAEGFYEQGWQNRARRAMEERQDGRFEEYLEELVEAAFGEAEVAGEAEEGDSEDGEWEA